MSLSDAYFGKAVKVDTLTAIDAYYKEVHVLPGMEDRLRVVPKYSKWLDHGMLFAQDDNEECFVKLDEVTFASKLVNVGYITHGSLRRGRFRLFMNKDGDKYIDAALYYASVTILD